MENKNTLAVSEKKQRTSTNPIKRAFAAVCTKVNRIIATVTTMLTVTLMTTVSAFAAPAGGGGGGLGDQGVDQFNEVIKFFATWIGRIGLVVAFVGGIMFGLAIKNEDAEAKTRGLMTLASGFVVFALTLALDFFMTTT